MLYNDLFFLTIVCDFDFVSRHLATLQEIKRQITTLTKKVIKAKHFHTKKRKKDISG